MYEERIDMTIMLQILNTVLNMQHCVSVAYRVVIPRI